MKTIKNLFVVLSTLFAYSFIGNAQENDEKQANIQNITIGTITQTPEFIRINPAFAIKSSEFTKWIKKPLKMRADDNFILLRQQTDKLGYIHEKYQQSYKGYPVEGGMYISHLKEGKIEMVNGDFYGGINTSVNIILTEEDALNKALIYVGAKKYKWENKDEEVFMKETTGNPSFTYFPQGKLVIMPKSGNFKDADFRLTYKFEIDAEEPLESHIIYIDAASGELIYNTDALFHGNATGSAETKYSGTQTITTDSTAPGSYRLRDYSRGNGIETYNLKKTTGSTKVDFMDSDNYWSNVNADQDEVATDAHWAAEMTHDYFQTRFGRNSWNNSGGKVTLYVHYGNNMNDANTNGTNGTINIGDGNPVPGPAGRSFMPWTSIETLAHEVFHNTSNYEVSWSTSTAGTAEPRALSEAVSDIFGVVVERWAKPNDTYTNWTIGDEHNIEHIGIRSMSDPPSQNEPNTGKPFPKAYGGANWATNGGQAYRMNSSIGNYWFYLLTDGGTGTIDDNGIDNYSITGIGIDKAAEIVYRAVVNYFTSSTNYAAARNYTIQAAKDLYGDCSQEVISTINAWYAVGVGGEYTAVITPVVTQNGTLLETSQNYTTYQWYKDGNAVTGATAYLYAHSGSGSYTVVVTDAAGCSATSSPFSITVGLSDIEGLESIDIYPNPGNGLYTLEMNMTKNVQVNIRISDMLGKNVYFQKKNRSSGKVIEKLDITGLPMGIYFVYLNNNDWQFVTKIIKH